MISLVDNLFFIKKNPLQDLLSSLNAVISTNESTRFITGHVIYNPAYTYKFHLKTTAIGFNLCSPLLSYDVRKPLKLARSNFIVKRGGGIYIDVSVLFCFFS